MSGITGRSRMTRMWAWKCSCNQKKKILMLRPPFIHCLTPNLLPLVYYHSPCQASILLRYRGLENANSRQKVSTNRDPLEAKQKKTLSEAKKGGAAALTKKTSFVTANSKATGKKASENGSGNSTPAIGSETNLESTEESAEAELGRNFFFFPDI